MKFIIHQISRIFVINSFFLFSFSLSTSFYTLKSNLHISQIASENNSGVIELYNASEEDIDLVDHGIRLEVDKDTTATINPDIFCLFTDNYPNEEGVVKSDLIIESHSYFLIVGQYAQSYTNQADFIVTNVTGLRGYLDTNDTLYLGVDSISGPTDNDILQFVGMGLNNSVFSGSAPAPSLPIMGSIERKAFFSSTSTSMSFGGDDHTQGNAFNSTDNASDFIVKVSSDLSEWQNKSSNSEVATKEEKIPFLHLLENLITPTAIGEETVSKSILSFLSEYPVVPVEQEARLKSILVKLDFKNPLNTSAIREMILHNDVGQSISLSLLSNEMLSYYYGVVEMPLSYSLQNTVHQVKISIDSLLDYNTLSASLNPNLLINQENIFFYGSVINSQNNLHFLKKIFFSEIKSQGQSSKDEYVEFYNPNTNNFSLLGWQLYYQSSTGAWQRQYTFPSIDIPAQGYLLLAGMEYSGKSSISVPDLINDLSLSGGESGFGLSLRDDNNAIVDEIIIGDKISEIKESTSWGEPFPINPNSQQAIERKALMDSDADKMIDEHFYYGNHYHSDNNKNDFVLVDSPYPQNRFANSEPNTNVVLSLVTGRSNTYGGKVVVEGENFWNYQEDSSLIYLNNVALSPENIINWSDTNIVFTLPRETLFPAQLKIQKRTHLSFVTVEANYLQPLELFPFQIDSISPLTPHKGHLITIEGNHFGFLPALDFKLNDITIDFTAFLEYQNNKIQFLLSTNLDSYQSGNNNLLIEDLQSGQSINQMILFTTNSPPLVRTQHIAIDKNNIGLKDEFTFFYQYVDIDGDAISIDNGNERLPKVFFWQNSSEKNNANNKIEFILDSSHYSQNQNNGKSENYSKTISTDDFYGWAENTPIYYHVFASDVVQPHLLSSNYFLPEPLFIDGIPPKQTSYFTIKETTPNQITCQWQSVLKDKNKSLDSDFYQIKLFDNDDIFLKEKRIVDLATEEMIFSGLESDSYYKLYFSIVDFRGNENSPLSAIAKTKNPFNDKLFIEKKVRNDIVTLYNLKKGTRLEVYDRGGQLRKEIAVEQNQEKYFLKINPKDNLKKGIFYIKSIFSDGEHKLFWLVY